MVALLAAAVPETSCHSVSLQPLGSLIEILHDVTTVEGIYLHRGKG